jgi:hypothetical protein
MMSFGAELRRAAAAAAKIVPRLVAERPEEWRVGPLTVVVDRAARAAQLRYARLTVARTSADPGAVMTAWRRAITALSMRSLPPDDLLPALAAAWAELASAPAAAAGRVDLVKLRDEIVRRQRDYTRAQFAWDIARLRRERRLVHDGRRIDLGAATGMAASRRSSVVWIEDESGAGQYYQTFRLIPQERP